MGRKTGNLNRRERAFIEQYIETKTDEWIAGELNRTVHQVENYRREYNAKQALTITESKDSYNYKYQLRTRSYWPELQKQFTGEELLLFEDYWTRYIEQFGGDILYTEESQLVDVVRYELLINRNLKEQAETVVQMDRLQKHIENELRLPVMNPERVASLEEQLQVARTTSSARTGEHVKLQNEKNKLFADLKATRDKRIKQLIDDKINIFTLFTQLRDFKTRQREAKQAGLFKLAMDKEELRLTQPYTFGDGQVDLPILSADTLERLDSESDASTEG